MERSNIFLSRTDESNTETPRACHIVALKLAGYGMKIPDDIRGLVVDSAERGGAELGEIIDFINILAGPALKYEVLRDNFLNLALKISASYGIDGPMAEQRRLDYMREELYKNEQSQEGVGFTE